MAPKRITASIFRVRPFQLQRDGVQCSRKALFIPRDSSLDPFDRQLQKVFGLNVGPILRAADPAPVLADKRFPPRAVLPQARRPGGPAAHAPPQLSG
jgi:hypothetical protein